MIQLKKLLLYLSFTVGFVTIINSPAHSQVQLGDVLFPNTTGGTITIDTMPPGSLPSDSLSLLGQLVGSNPSVDFSGLPFGPYWFLNTVTSVAMPSLSKQTRSSFYHLDLGTITSDTIDICDTTSVVLLSNIIDTLIYGPDASYAFSGATIIGGDTLILGTDTIDLEIIRTPIIPTGYTSDCVEDTIYNRFIPICCGTDTIVCDTSYVQLGVNINLRLLPDPGGTLTWSGGQLPVTVLPSSDSIEITGVSLLDLGNYYAVHVDGPCTKVYEMNLGLATCSPDSICGTYSPTSFTNLDMTISPSVGAVLWTLPDGSQVYGDTLQIINVTPLDYGTYIAEDTTSMCIQRYVLGLGVAPNPMIQYKEFDIEWWIPLSVTVLAFITWIWILLYVQNFDNVYSKK